MSYDWKSTKELAELLKVSVSFLNHDRLDLERHALGLGIPFFRIGRKVLYCLADVEKWAEVQRANPIPQPIRKNIAQRPRQLGRPTKADAIARSGRFRSNWVE
jgi:hypothetical protein